MHNSNILYFKTPKKNKLPYLIFFSLIILIILSYHIEIYDTYKTIGIATCNDRCEIEINISSINSEIINNKLELEYKSKKYKVFKIITKDIYLENNIVYQKLIIETELILNSNNFIEFKLLYNKQRIINKIIDILKWKEYYEQIKRWRISWNRRRRP